MGIDLNGNGYNDLLAHVGHKIVCVAYGNMEHPENTALECEDCGVVLIDFNFAIKRQVYLELRTDDAGDEFDLGLVALTDTEYERYLDSFASESFHVYLFKKESVDVALLGTPRYPFNDDDSKTRGWVGLEELNEH